MLRGRGFHPGTSSDAGISSCYASLLFVTVEQAWQYSSRRVEMDLFFYLSKDSAIPGYVSLSNCAWIDLYLHFQGSVCH